MKRTILMAALIAAIPAVGHSAGKPQDRSHPAWLVGDWGDVEGGGQPDCGDHSIVYDAAGRYEFASLLGTWIHKDGQLCTRQLLEDAGGPSPTYFPGPLECQPVRRQGARVAVLADGKWVTMARCGPGVVRPTARQLVDQAERRRQRGGRPR